MTPARLECRGLTRRLREFSLEIDLWCESWPLVLLGPSGAGKSQLLRLLAGLERPDQGRVSFDGIIWADATTGRFIPAHRREVGLCQQEPLLFPHRRVLANVAFPLEGAGGLARPAREEKARAALHRLRLDALANARPGRLSGGEERRVALARALVREPRLLLLDEPFAALDPSTQLELIEVLREILGPEERPAVWVTHDQREARALGATVAVLLRGRIAQIGPVDAVFGQPATPEVALFLDKERFPLPNKATR